MRQSNQKDVTPVVDDPKYDTKEDLFYMNFCPTESDMWLALDEEVAAIEKFLMKKWQMYCNMQIFI